MTSLFSVKYIGEKLQPRGVEDYWREQEGDGEGI